jgi:DNA polymerase-1
MKIIDTSAVQPEDLTQWEKDQVYNGLDTCVTAEVLDVLLPELDNQTSSTYAFSRALQGPALEMRLRGVRIDLARRDEVVEELVNKIDHLERNLQRIVGEALGLWDFKWSSNKDLMELFYDNVGIPVIRKKGRPTVNRDALERMEQYLIARPLVGHIKTMRDLAKKVSMLKTKIDADGRIRTSYNIGGTTTGRLSSSFSEFGTGTNLQNIEESLRSVFIADRGMKMAYFDAEQGESRCVGAIEWNLFNDGRYLDACESGDLHTSVAKLCWKDLKWTGNLQIDKELAEQPYYRHYSRRFMCKKIGHGTNYGGQPETISTQAKVPIGMIIDFQPVYFSAFPAHLQWHDWTDRTLRREGVLTSLTGRRRHFFGRRNDPDTLRAAIAYDPQGSLADIVNNGMLQLWRERVCILLMQIHDAVIVQFPEELEDDVIPKIKRLLEYRVELNNGRDLVIPYGCKTGWNWGEYCCGNYSDPKCKQCPHKGKTNPNGLKSYKGGDQRRRIEEVELVD